MSLLVDTSVWSLALRRDRPSGREVDALRGGIERGEVVLTGIILQEILQGFPNAERTRRLADHLAPFPLLALHRGDYVYAAEIRNKCRAKGVAISTVDAQIAAAAINHRCALLTADADFAGRRASLPLAHGLKAYAFHASLNVVAFSTRRHTISWPMPGAFGHRDRALGHHHDRRVDRSSSK